MSNTYTIGFTGDLGFSSYLQKAYKKEDLLHPELKAFFADNDANVINYENPVTPCRVTTKKRLAHRSDPAALDFVRNNIKNPVLSFANNHLMDYGYIGMIDTIEIAEEQNFPYIGAGRNLEEASKMLILGNENVKIGIISMQYKKYMVSNDVHGGPYYEGDDLIIRERIAKYRQAVDWIVLVYHGGDEFLYSPMPYIRKRLKKYLDWGCDVVVGHHPHVVQGYEYFGNKAIFYSLGNFIFDTDYQRAQEGVRNGMLLRLKFSKDSFSFENQPTLIDSINQLILPGSSDPHFIDIGKTNYTAMWTSEAYRKLEITEKAALLKEKELQEKELFMQKESERINELKRSHILKLIKMDLADESYFDDSDDEPEEVIVKKDSFYKKLRSLYRIIFVNASANRNAITLRFGRLLYRLFYRHKKVF